MSVLAIAERKGREKGLEEGREAGLEEGREAGLEEGREEGREEGLKQAISDILAIKFGMIGLDFVNQVAQIRDREVLQKIRADLKQAQSLEEAETLLLARATERA